MNNALTLSLMAIFCAAAGPAAAQQQVPPTAAPAAPSVNPNAPTAQSEAGEPRADTSSEPAATEAPGSPAGPPASSAAPAGRAPAARASAAPVPAAHPGPPKTSAGPAKSDRLELGTATVTGDREQPKVMYIVPWKRSDIGDLAGKPMNSLVDEILSPVDRDVFKREVVYYHAVQADASQNGAPPKPAQQGEK
jgi:hypothetical protein